MCVLPVYNVATWKVSTIFIEIFRKCFEMSNSYMPSQVDSVRA
jgi:hypothetical protein